MKRIWRVVKQNEQNKGNDQKVEASLGYLRQYQVY